MVLHNFYIFAFAMIPFFLFTDGNDKSDCLLNNLIEKGSGSFNQGEEDAVFTCLGCEFCSLFFSVWLFQMLK